MPSFTIKGRTPPRFEGDFQIDTDSDYTPNDAERAYLDDVNSALTLLAVDETGDVSRGYPTVLLTGRRKAREAAAAGLQANAQEIARGQLAPEKATESVAAIEDRYLADVPKFGVMDTTAPRFEGDFEIVIVDRYGPTDSERVYLGNLKNTMGELATDEERDPTANYSNIVLVTRRLRRKDAASQLRSQAEKFTRGDLSAADAADSVLVIKGSYRALRDRLTRRLFNVTVMKGENEKKKDEDLAIDVDIRLLSGLPPPEDAVLPEKQDLFVQINKTGTVIRTVCQRMRDRADSWWSKNPDAAREHARRLLDEYMDKLAGIAVIGLEYPHTQLAKLALTELKAEFAAQEAGRIKNKYVRWLGAWAGVAALMFIIAYIAIVIKFTDWQWGQLHKSFLLAAVGAAIGTWVSFSARQVQLSFDDLLMLEEDSLDPPLRVIFVVALTLTACLLFWTSAMNIEIGSLKTNPESFRIGGSIALLIGMFCGLAERALATALSGRAAAFVRGVAGGA